MNDLNIKHFEENWDLMPEDFKIETYRENIFDDMGNQGVRITLIPYNISVGSHKLKGQIANRDKCLEMLSTILTNYLV